MCERLRAAAVLAVRSAFGGQTLSIVADEHLTVSRSPLLGPFEQENEAVHVTVDQAHLAQIVDLLHLNVLAAEIFDEQCEQAWIGLQLQPAVGQIR